MCIGFSSKSSIWTETYLGHQVTIFSQQRKTTTTTHGIELRISNYIIVLKKRIHHYHMMIHSELKQRLNSSPPVDSLRLSLAASEVIVTAGPIAVLVKPLEPCVFNSGSKIAARRGERDPNKYPPH